MQALIDRVRAGTPLVEFMDLAYDGSTSEQHQFSAAYTQCKNQLDVGFGGAIASCLTLAGWFSFTQACEAMLARDCNPVVAQVSLKFIAPMRGDRLLFVSPVVVLNPQSGRIRYAMSTQALDESGQRCADAQLEFVL